MSGLTAVPGWPGIYVEEISGFDAIELQEVQSEPVRGAIRVARLCARHDTGSPIWPDDESAGKAPMRLLRAISEAAFKASGLSDDVETVAGN